MAKSKSNITYQGCFLEIHVKDCKEAFSPDLLLVIPSRYK